ncbi:MAG: hypothetical protein IT373_12770 [Polyangiaceae bacterium]|nr:hypothetical protein [Polyangiaceae bacterium]
MTRPLGYASLVAATTCALGACDAGRPDADELVPVSLVGAEATTGYRALPQYAEQVATYSPLVEGSVLHGVSRAATLALYFDRLLLPSTVTRQAVCVRNDGAPVDKLDQCTGPTQDFLAVEYDPARRRVLFRGATFDPGTTYKMTLFVPESPTDWGFRAFDGAPLARKYELLFETAPDVTAPPAEIAHTAADYCDAVGCANACRLDHRTDAAALAACVAASCPFRAQQEPLKGCGSGGCHEATEDDPDAAAGLRLQSPEDILASAIGVTAHQTATGAAAQTPTQNGQPFGRAMPILDRGNPGNSYLVYKAVAHADSYCSLRDDCPEPDDPGLRAEIVRLRDAFVIGAPMPAKGSLLTVTNGAPTFDGLRVISDWIAWGAPFCTCVDDVLCAPDPTLPQPP